MVSGTLFVGSSSLTTSSRAILTPPTSTAASAAAADVRNARAPAGGGGAEGRKRAAKSRRRAREGEGHGEGARVEEKAAVVGSVAMARTRARRQAVRISGRMAALAGLSRGFSGWESESERGTKTQERRARVKIRE